MRIVKEMDKALKKMDYPLIAMTAKRSGFLGQRLVVVHPSQRSEAICLDLLRCFCLTDIGFFPLATEHERRRPYGSSQTIFIHCVAGEGWCEMEGIRYTIKPHDLLMIPARCTHAYGASKTSPWSIEWFHGIGVGLSEIQQHLGLSKEAPVLSLQPEVWDSSLFEEALSTLEAGFTDNHLIHAAWTLSHLLSRIFIRQRGNGVHSSELVMRLEKVATFLREHPTQSTNVSQMATMAGLSPSHFTGLFHTYIGHSPIDYLIRIRIKRACRLLDLTTLSIKEISERVGYSDPYYFSRAFKKVTMLSPRAYRDTHKG